MYCNLVVSHLAHWHKDATFQAPYLKTILSLKQCENQTKFKQTDTK